MESDAVIQKEMEAQDHALESEVESAEAAESKADKEESAMADAMEKRGVEQEKTNEDKLDASGNGSPQSDGYATDGFQKEAGASASLLEQDDVDGDSLVVAEGPSKDVYSSSAFIRAHNP